MKYEIVKFKEYFNGLLDYYGDKGSKSLMVQNGMNKEIPKILKENKIKLKEGQGIVIDGIYYDKTGWYMYIACGSKEEVKEIKMYDEKEVKDFIENDENAIV